MSSPVERFWDQYKENVHAARRNRKYKFARLFWAFLLTIVIAPICYGLRDLTGSNTLAAVFGVVAALFGLVVWWVIESIWRSASDRREAAEADILTAQPVPVTGQQLAAPAWQPPAGPPLAPPKRSGNGLLLALLGTFSVLALSCCGGGIAIVTLASHWAAPQAAQPQQGGNGFNFGPNPFPARPDPFADLHRDHQKQLDETRRRQDEMLRDLERRRPGFGP